jgi:hypothetical protein
MKKIFSILSVIALCMLLAGCMTPLMWTPLSDINKLGTVLGPDEQIVIQNTNGTVTVKYLGPTQRQVIWNDQTCDMSLRKSAPLNGIYSEFKKNFSRSDAPNNVKYVSFYQESTAVLKSKKDVDNMIKADAECGFQSRPETHMLVRLYVGKYCNFGIKSWTTQYLSIQIHKYEIDEKNGRSYYLSDDE